MNVKVRTPVSRRWRLGTLGHLGCLVFAMVLAVFASGIRLVFATLLVGLLVSVFQPGGFRALASRRVWVILVLMFVPVALLIGQPDLRLWGVPLSREGIDAGIEMALRALAIIVGVTGFATSVSVSEASGLLERAGLKGLGFAFGVAVNMLPTLAETSKNAYHAMRLRGGLRRQRLRSVRLLLVTIVANSLRHAEDIVNAAEARAFAANRARPLPLLWRPTDLALSATLLVTATAVLLM